MELLKLQKKPGVRKRRKRKFFSHLREAYKRNKITEVWLLYGLYPQTANEWKRELEAEFTEIQFSCYPLGAVIGVHAGEDTIGISWYNELQ